MNINIKETNLRFGALSKRNKTDITLGIKIKAGAALAIILLFAKTAPLNAADLFGR